MKKVVEFLSESNAIEQVYDDYSLKVSIKAWEYCISNKIMSTKVVLEIHRILMSHHLCDEFLGKFRKCEVRIGGRYGLPYKLISQRMEEWCRFMNKEGADEEFIKMLHVDYEMIHPFGDGNGRTGRIFMNWARVKNGLPILVIKETKKGEYYKWFE